MKFTVIYLWRGERHRHSLVFTDASRAELLAVELRAAGWRAWMEPLR